MARKNLTNVFESFLNGDAKKGATISTDGKVIYSYATAIAWGVYDAAGRLSGIDINPERYSVTTTCQQNGIRELARRHEWLIVKDRERA